MRHHSVAKAIVGGLLGTLLQTIMVYGVAPMRMLLLEESSVLHHKVQVFLVYACRMFSASERVPPRVF